MHENIRRFSQEGVVIEGINVVDFKDKVIRWTEGQMRDEGYAPALDIEAQYTQQYNPKDNNYTFQLSVYGLFVGKEKAWDTAGVMNGRMIMRSTRPIKSRAS